MAACDAASLAMRDPKKQAGRACARRNLSVRHKNLMCGCSVKRAHFRANAVPLMQYEGKAAGRGTLNKKEEIQCRHSINWFAREGQRRITKRPALPFRLHRNVAAFVRVYIPRRPKSQIRRCAKWLVCA